MEEIKIGEYVRTETGKIGRVISIDEDIDWIETTLNRGYVHPIIEFKKHSKNIIDLIEVGDYVNGELVTDKLQTPCKIGEQGKKFVFTKNMNIGEGYFQEDIKSIVTKEQIEDIEYRLEK